MYVGWGLTLDDSWWECVPCVDSLECECWQYFKFTFDTSCDNWICLDSTKDIYGNPCNEETKLVDFEYDITWLGCEFDYILAHKNHVPESLLPRLKNHRQIFVII